MLAPVPAADWPLRAKMAALLIAASLVPLALLTYLDLQRTRVRLFEGMQSLLEARADQIVSVVEGFHRSYDRAADRMVRYSHLQSFCTAAPDQRAALHPQALAMLQTFPSSDPGIRGAALIDGQGRIILATELQLNGIDLSSRPKVREALQGRALISEPFLSSERSGSIPTIAYFAPMSNAPGGRPFCIAALWVRAAALWDQIEAANGQAGHGSYAVLLDPEGIRIAHTESRELLFRPTGRLDVATVDRLVTDRRFGAHTREWLDDVRPFSQLFERARAQTPDLALFRGLAPLGQRWTFGIGRRIKSVPWTVFYLVPEEVYLTQVAQATRERLLVGAAVILAAGAAGLLFAASIVRPIHALTAAATAIAGGNLRARVGRMRRDELGVLGTSFDAMAERIETQALGLERSRDELEERVRERTAALESEMISRQRTEARLQAQLARLQLLDEITCAIGQRQDLQSIYQVVIGTLEDHLPVDFALICGHDAAEHALTIIRVGARSDTLAQAMAMQESTRVPIDENGLSRCVRGELVYEPDLRQVEFPFPQRLARVGLGSLVAVPLLSQGRTFGILVVARLASEAFSSGECEFLRQLGSHTALAAQQTELRESLQHAYDDLRLTQQAVMQQERLRALGQMASGIAHDINNAISPVSLYAGHLLESETGLSVRGRGYLETIARAIDDVASTVARMREFYRQQDAPGDVRPLQLNVLVQQVLDLTRARWGDMPQQRGVVIQLQTALDPMLIELPGSESELREALINLVFNAVDAMPEGGVLTLRTGVTAAPLGSDPRGSGRRVFVEVADTGMGMDEPTRRRCLEPFFTTKGERGTGLGLAMVYGVVQRHGAGLEIDSTPGGGTCVRLDFPWPQEPLSPGETETIPQRPAHGQRILVIDDDPLIVRSLTHTLEHDGHHVTSASGGQAGIETFARAHGDGDAFDIVISDLGMPHVDGLRVAAAVKQLDPATPLLLLTGWGRRLEADGEVPPFVDQVLSKPPKLHELRSALARLTSAAGVAAPPGKSKEQDA